MVPDAEHRQRRDRTAPSAVVLLVVLLGIITIAAGIRSRSGTADPASATPADVAATPTATGDHSGLGSPTTPSADPTPGGTDTPQATIQPTAEVVETPRPTPTRSPDDLPMTGPGTFTWAADAGVPVGIEPYTRYAVAVEDDIGVDPAEVASIVDTILGDQRSWIGGGDHGFHRVGKGESVTFTLVVASPGTVDTLCAPLETVGRYSCGRNGWIALNLLRWETAAEVWPSDLEVYRQYLVNHEVGHYLVGDYHDNNCPSPGALAPIMMQQSIDLLGCFPNGWVYPDGPT